MTSKDTEFFQNIVLTFTGGKEIIASVPAFAFSDKDLEDIKLESVKISKPKKMPKDCSFSQLTSDEK